MKTQKSLTQSSVTSKDSKKLVLVIERTHLLKNNSITYLLENGVERLM